MARQLFLDTSEIIENKVVFNENNQRHLISLRQKTDDIIDCIIKTKSNSSMKCKVRLIKDGNIYIGEILETEEISTNRSKKIHIIQCIPKLDKMEYIIQKCSELDVFEIIPVFSKFTQIKVSVGDNKLNRWNKISSESSNQSGRKDILNITTPQDLNKFFIVNDEILKSNSTICIALSEFEKKDNIHSIESKIKNPKIKDIYILIGSEGGFDASEIEIAQKYYNFISISLGENILRTETASIVIVSILQYLLKNI